MKINIDEKRIPEILLAIILVVVLLIAILFVTNQSTGKSVSTISNSQNTNSYNTYNYYNEREVYSPTRNSGYVKIYDSRDDYSDEKFLSYDSRSEIERAKGLFGNDIDRYKVYVKNTGYKGGYFKVNFYFEDYHGDKRVETITKYIPAREEEIFYYTDVYADRLTNYRWSFKITSQTKI